MLKAFGLVEQSALVALVGGGGKTSLMFALAAALPGRVVVTTTTRMFASQIGLASAVCKATNLETLGDKLGQHGVCLVVGKVQGDKAFGVSPDLPGRLWARPDVDFVLVEADGSRMRPIKAPAPHEPVIPKETTLLIPMMGIDALDGRLVDMAHRPELVAQLLKIDSDARLEPSMAATLLTHVDGGLKGAPGRACVIPFINKVETIEQMVIARRIAYHMLSVPRVDRVIIGAVQRKQPIREVHRRVTAVILAAGQSRRMGCTKQLLPWGQTTVLGQTIEHVQQAAVQEIVVVSGHQAAEVEAIARAYNVSTIYNPHYATGEMLSSLQMAVRHLSGQETAVLVILADQPMVEPGTIDQLLVAYWQRQSDLIAPIYQGQRGNPVLIGRAYFDELLALPLGMAPRELIKRHDDQLHLVTVDSKSVIQDLDRLEVYERLRP